MLSRASGDHAAPQGLSRIGRYGLAVVMVALAALLRHVAADVFAPTPYVAFGPAVVVAAAFGGLGPGLLATILSFLCVCLVFAPAPPDGLMWIRHGVFLALGVGISLVCQKWLNGERRQRQQARELAEMLRKYRAVAENTRDWEFWIAPGGSFLYVSPSCLEVTGYAAAEFVADPKLADRIVHPDDRGRYREHRVQVDQACNTPGLEFRIIRRDGSIRWMSHACVPIHDEAGTFLGARGSNRDITDRKLAEEALLASKVSAERAKAAAEQANRAKDHFMAVLSHELRNPLTPVLATVSLLQADERFDPEVLEHLEVIRRNAELEARLIDDLLDVTRISHGKVELDRRPVELCTILRHAVEVCKPDIQARNLEFGLDIKDPPHIVYADPGRLQQVFWNVIKNAIKFTPPNGCVGVRCWAESDHVMVRVSDSGVGIEPEALSRIFSAFEQAEVSVTRQFGGLGLGLAISRALVEMHGGAISAQSEGKGKGSTFTVMLPLSSSSVPAVAQRLQLPQADSRVPAANALRILLVEDHGDTARIMTQLLLKEGYEVHAAGDVATALGLASRQRFDLLLSDLGLPDGSGLDLLRELRARGYIFPAIALSGYGQEQDVRQSLAAGFSLHLTKPVDVPRLAEAVAALTGRAAALA